MSDEIMTQLRAENAALLIERDALKARVEALENPAVWLDHLDPARGKFLDTETAVSILLREDVLFCNSRDYADDWSFGHTLVLFVLCNDTFAYACADAEDIAFNEVGTLYDLWTKDHMWGPVLWCVRKRKVRPILPIERDLRAAGLWDAECDALPPRPVRNTTPQSEEK